MASLRASWCAPSAPTTKPMELAARWRDCGRAQALLGRAARPGDAAQRGAHHFDVKVFRSFGVGVGDAIAPAASKLS